MKIPCVVLSFAIAVFCCRASEAIDTSSCVPHKDPVVSLTTLNKTTTTAVLSASISCAYSKADPCVYGGLAGAVTQIDNINPYSNPQEYIYSIQGTNIESIAKYFNTGLYNIITLRVAAAVQYIKMSQKLPDYCNMNNNNLNEILSCSTATDPTSYVDFANENNCTSVLADPSCLFISCNSTYYYDRAYSYWASNAVQIYQKDINRSSPNFIQSYTTNRSNTNKNDNNYIAFSVTMILFVALLVT